MHNNAWLGLAAGLLCGCSSSRTTSEPRTVLVELSSPDEGYVWHLHARDGELLCELPCEHEIGQRSGTYLAVHDPRKSWRIDLPSSLQAPPGSHVSMAPHVGKGTPALGTLGTSLGIAGAASAAAGIGLLFAAYIHMLDPDGGTLFFSSMGFLGAGVVMGVPGFWLEERNRASSLRVRFVGNGLVGSF